MKTLKNEKQVEEFVIACMHNMKEAYGDGVTIDKDFLYFTVKMRGKKYNQTITTSVMRYILEVQKSIESAYVLSTGKSITKAVKEELELVVKVEKGSSNFIIWLADQMKVLEGALHKMTGDQIFTVAIVAVVAFSATSIAKHGFDFFKAKNETALQLQREKLQTEKDKHTLDTFASVVTMLDEKRTSSLRLLEKIDSEDSFEFNGETISKGDIKQRLKAMPEEAEAVIVSETCLYKITKLVLDFDKQSGSIDLYDDSKNETITKVSIQSHNFLGDGISVLEKVMDLGTGINLEIITHRKNGVIEKAYLSKIL